MAVDRRDRPVPTGRLNRLLGIGSMLGGIGANVALAGAKQVLSGHPPDIADLLSAPSNALRLANKLSHMRGAAMKLGQMLSMDAGQVLPPEWSPILSRLQADASPMPRQQLEAQLTRYWGRNWRDQFSSFSFEPIAAASIGQVHRARTREGRDLAIKVQYPGVAASIDSDLKNLASLLRLSRLLPDGFPLDSLIKEAALQLREEADYLREAEQTKQYSRFIADDTGLVLPDVDDSLTRADILAMTFVESKPIEFVAALSQNERNRVVERLCRLVLEEVFNFGVVQTDANFANFRYQPSSGRIVLLDFGATRTLPVALRFAFGHLLRAALANDRSQVHAAMLEIGYFANGQDRLAELALDLLALGMDAVNAAPLFDFAAADLPAQARDRALALGIDSRLVSVPPVEALFVHRKIGGIYLLAAKLRAKVNLRALLEEFAPAG